MDPQDQGEEDGANVDLDAQRKGKCAVIKTSTRQVKLVVVHQRIELTMVFLCLLTKKWHSKQ